MLGQVLGRRLLGQAGTVQELPLQQWEIGLQKGDDEWPQWEVGGFLELGMKFFDRQS